MHEAVALVQSAKSGNHEAFDALVNEHVHHLYATAYHILRDEALAQEAVQDAMIRTWRSLPTLRDVDRFDAWLYRLLVNACKDQLRKRRRDEGRMGSLTGDEVAPESTSPSALLDRDELVRAMRGLNFDQRTLLVLVYYRGFTLTAAAESLGVPAGTAKSRLARALTALREELMAQRLPKPIEEAQANG